MSTYEDRKVKGIVFNIQKYSVHDGPGIRTIVFTKGCHLRCRWCSNPESQVHKPQMAFNPGRCISPEKCGYCIPACPYGSIKAQMGALDIDCSHCADCETFGCVIIHRNSPTPCVPRSITSPRTQTSSSCVTPAFLNRARIPASGNPCQSEVT